VVKINVRSRRFLRAGSPPEGALLLVPKPVSQLHDSKAAAARAARLPGGFLHPAGSCTLSAAHNTILINIFKIIIKLY
jgi:hypothetical protein